MTRFIIAILLMIVLFTCASLVTGAAYLLWLLPGGLPFGNGLTAAGLSSAAVIALLLSKPKSVLRWIAIGSIVLSVIWLPISIGLAGNLSLNFDGTNGLVWRRFTLATFAFVLMSMLWAIAQSFVDRSMGRRT
jgi:hypothetical protein